MVDADLGDVLGIFVHGPMRMPGAFVIVLEGFWRRVKGMNLRGGKPALPNVELPYHVCLAGHNDESCSTSVLL